jgi:hypothetical protein
LAVSKSIIKNAKAGDQQTDTIQKIKLWDKPRDLKMLAKHLALLTDVVQTNGSAEFNVRMGEFTGRQHTIAIPILPMPFGDWRCGTRRPRSRNPQSMISHIECRLTTAGWASINQLRKSSSVAPHP